MRTTNSLHGFLFPPRTMDTRRDFKQAWMIRLTQRMSDAEFLWSVFGAGDGKILDDGHADEVHDE
jgi:hypothetical protein